MDPNLQMVLDEAMRALIARIEADDRLTAERQRARRGFLGDRAGANLAGRGVAEAADRRFYEWFALERESEVLGTIPVATPRFAADEALMGSTCGVFTVTSAAAAGTATARDLQDGTMLELMVPDMSLAAGDLVVGRLFPAGVGQWLPSVAATVFRPGGALAEAFEQDVERIEANRRLEQIELELLLLRRPQAETLTESADDPAPPLEHLEADLEQLLQGSEFTASVVSEQLATCDRPGQVMGPLLDALAFETEADLDTARRVLLSIWNAQHADAAVDAATANEGNPEQGGDEAGAESPEASSSGPPGETLGERMVRQLDDGLRRQRDVDGLFADLESMAGLEPGAADDEENPFDREDAGAGEPGVDGNLDPLVQEFLWEGGRVDDPAAGRPLRTWVQLQANAAVPRVDLEDVTGLDVMRLLMHIYLGTAPEQRVAVVRSAFTEVQEFFAWAEATQEFELQAVLTEARAGLVEHLERLAGAGLALSTEMTAAGRPTLLEVVDVTDAGFGVGGEDGDDHWVPADPAVCSQLRTGDLVLGSMHASDGGRAFSGPVVVLPPQARQLME